MSAVRAALFARLTGDATLTGLLGDGADGLHHRQAPAGAAFPLIILSRQASTTNWTNGDSFDTELWLVKAVHRDDSGVTADAVDARIQALLNDYALAPAGFDAMNLRRESAVDYGEPDADEMYHHVGSIYRLDIQAT